MNFWVSSFSKNLLTSTFTTSATLAARRSILFEFELSPLLVLLILLFNFDQAHAFFSQLFNFSDDGEVFKGVTSLSATCSMRNYNSIKFLFPEA